MTNGGGKHKPKSKEKPVEQAERKDAPCKKQEETQSQAGQKAVPSNR